MDLVSIIMPYYKKRNYINKSINSVLRQTYQNFEIIIIYDDIDLDDSDFINNIKKKDNRIFVIYNSKNLGAGISRNIGIKHAKGNFVGFLDCDDIWKKNKLESQINFMNKKKIDFSFTSYDLINSKNIKIGTRLAKPILNYQDLLKSCDIGLSTVIFKKKIFDNYCKFPNLKTKEDFVMWLKIAKKGIILYGMQSQLSQWRKTSGSLSSDIIQKIYDGFRVYYKHLNFGFFKSIYYLVLLSLNSFKR